MKKKELSVVKIPLEGTPEEQMKTIAILLETATSGLDNLVGRVNPFSIIYQLDNLETSIQIIRRRIGGRAL